MPTFVGVMRKILFIILLSAFPLTIYCQDTLSYDTIIDRGIYRAYFNRQYSTTTKVIYTMYRAGGKAKRKGLDFRVTFQSNYFNYYRSGYDKGHLAAAADFAQNRELMAVTFDYLNCLPQRPSLNRGAWKKLETYVRKLSQYDTIMVECGGLMFDSIKHQVPKLFYKIVTKNNGRDTLVNARYENK